MKEELSRIWANDKAAVEEGFTMVLDLYTSIWQSLYDHIQPM